MWDGNAYACNALPVKSLHLESSFFGMQVHLPNLQVKSVYQGSLEQKV